MASAGKFFSEGGNVVGIATAETELDLSGWQFDGDEGRLRTADCEALIDESFGVCGDGTGFGKVMGIDLQPDEATIGIGNGASQCAATQSQPGQ